MKQFKELIGYIAAVLMLVIQIAIGIIGVIALQDINI